MMRKGCDDNIASEGFQKFPAQPKAKQKWADRRSSSQWLRSSRSTLDCREEEESEIWKILMPFGIALVASVIAGGSGQSRGWRLWLSLGGWCGSCGAMGMEIGAGAAIISMT